VRLSRRNADGGEERAALQETKKIRISAATRKV
jgi:hypothetical protein